MVIMQPLNCLYISANKTVERPLHLALGVLGMAWLTYLGALDFLPLWTRFFFSIISLALLPGYAIFSLLTSVQKSHYDRLSILLVSTSLSFSYNFFLNTIVFAFNLALSQALLCSLTLTTTLYLSLIVIKIVSKSPFKSDPFHLTPAVLSFAVAAIVVAIFTFIKPIQGGYYAEELMVMQKVTLNPAITIKSLSIVQGEATTYLFIPFYLLMGMIGLICKVDVTVAIQIMWSFTSVLSLLCLTKITEFVTGSRKPAMVIATVYVITAMFFPQLRSDQLVFLLPTPDRYAFSAGVLLYLALFHFLVHVHDDKLNYAMFIGLVYIIVEVAFVHAREAIMVLGCIFLFLVISFLHQGRRSPYFFKTLVVIGVCIGALAVYKYVNLFVSPSLNDFVNASQTHLADLLRQTIGDGSFFSRVFYDLPNSPVERYEYNLGFRHLNPGSVFIGLTLISLPLYILSVNEIWRYWLPLLVSSVLLLLLSGPLKLLIGAMVGSEHLFRLTGLIYIPCLIIFADMLCLVVARIGMLSVSNWTKAFMIACLATFMLALPPIENKWFITNSRLGDAAFLLGVVVFILLKSSPAAWRYIQSILAMPRVKNYLDNHWQAIALVFLVIVAILPLTPYLKTFNYGGVINLDYTQHYDDGSYQSLSRISAHDMLGQSFIKDYYVPETIYKFIRDKLPGQATWLGRSTILILIGSNHYSPILTYNGSMIGAYMYNDSFIKEFEMQDFSFLKLIDKPARFLNMLGKYGVDYLLVEPNEVDPVLAGIEKSPDLAPHFQTVFQEQGFAILKVVHPKAATDSKTAN